VVEVQEVGVQRTVRQVPLALRRRGRVGVPLGMWCWSHTK
jgi:hypothetical protein